MAFMRKATTGIAAISLAAVILTGTFAWVSLNTQIINEWRGTGNQQTGPGGTLHDDHEENQENKDVYVENWGDEDLFVRVKLSEYMEVGQGAGIKSVSTDPSTGEIIHNPLNLSQALTGGDIDHLDTWASIWYRFLEPEDIITGGNYGSVAPQYRLNNYWEWKMGGQKYYFPAPESNRTDNGYVDQNSPDNLTENSVSADGAKARLTLPASIMTITEWKNAGRPIGNYWVIDRSTEAVNDCWAYWAAPLKPGDATGLLLDKVTRIGNDSLTGLFDLDKEGYYYGINVAAQMATKDGSDTNGALDNYESFGLPMNSGWSTDGEALMEKVVSSGENTNTVYAEPVYSLEDGITRIQFNPPLLNGVIYVRQGTSLTAGSTLDSNDDTTEFTIDPVNNAAYSINYSLPYYCEVKVSAALHVDPETNGLLTNAGVRGNMTAKTVSCVTGPGPAITVPFVIIPINSQGVVFGKSGRVYIDYGNNSYQEIKDDGSLGSAITADDII